MTTQAEFAAWLKRTDSTRCVLVEVSVRVSGSETTRYLSNIGYVTGAADTPAHTAYLPIVKGGVSLRESLSLDGQASISYGDIELDNPNGVRDSWFDDVWANRQIRIYLGDAKWARADFYLVFDGLVADVDSADPHSINLRLVDKLQRLNVPLTETTLGGSTNNKDRILPLTFGEVFNIEPLLTNPSTLEYQYHQGASEGLIEVRDNGAPISTFTANTTTSKVYLTAAPVGQVTVSAQGDGSVSAGAADSNFSFVTLLLHMEGANGGTTFVDNSPTPKTLTKTGDVTTTTSGPLVGTSSALFGTGASYVVVSGDHSATGNFCYEFTYSPASMTGAKYILRLGAEGANRFVLMLSGANLILDRYGIGAVINYATGWAANSVNRVALERVGSTITLYTGGVARATYTYSGTFGNASLTSLGDAASSTNAPTGKLDEVRFTVGVARYGANYTPSTVAFPDSGSVAGAYNTTVARVVERIVTAYGPPSTRLSSGDLDSTQLTAFNSAHTQPVGLYAGDRENVLDVCQRLASSVGASVAMTSQGLLRLVKLGLPASGASWTLTDSDIDYDSLQIASRPPVKAAVRLGYCRNWTVQTSGLAAGLPASSAAEFGEEWRTVTVTDSSVATVYKLSAQPVQEDTLLLREVDASAEATRRLNLWKVPRAVYSAKAMPHMLVVELGDAVTLTHSRFGLSGGKAGIVVGIDRDWLSGEVSLEVLA